MAGAVALPRRSILIAMSESWLCEERTLLDILMLMAPYEAAALLRSCKRFAARSSMLRAHAESVLQAQVEYPPLDRQRLGRHVRAGKWGARSWDCITWHADFTGANLNQHQLHHVGWLMSKLDHPLSHLDTFRVSEHDWCLSSLRASYTGSPSRFFHWLRRPPKLQLAKASDAKLSTQDLLVFFSLCAGQWQSVDAIAAGARCGMPKLRELDLSGCVLSDEVMAAFGRALSAGAMPNLWSLSAAGCMMSDQGLASLAAALSQTSCASLQFVDLSSNCVGGPGAAALTAAVMRGAAPSLCVLDLSGNPIEPCADEALRAACDDAGVNYHCDASRHAMKMDEIELEREGSWPLNFL